MINYSNINGMNDVEVESNIEPSSVVVSNELGISREYVEPVSIASEAKCECDCLCEHLSEDFEQLVNTINNVHPVANQVGYQFIPNNHSHGNHYLLNEYLLLAISTMREQQQKINSLIGSLEQLEHQKQ